jgi:hypothetical protein
MDDNEVQTVARLVEKAIAKHTSPPPAAGSPEAFADGMLSAVQSYLKRCLDPLRERVAALEQRGSMSFEAAFDPGRAYVRGSVVQRNSGLYVAMIDAPTGTPGSSENWRRIGRDS